VERRAVGTHAERPGRRRPRALPPHAWPRRRRAGQCSSLRVVAAVACSWRWD
jgi:hypothetical protein